MNSENEIVERLVVLETNDKNKDRELKEIKNKVDNLSTLFNSQALATQSIQSDMSYLRNEITSIAKFIEELKSQPQKELNKFAWLIVTLITNTIWGVILFYFNFKK